MKKLKKRRTQVFVHSNAHSRVGTNIMCPGLALFEYIKAFKQPAARPSEDCDIDVLADVRKAHLAYWKMVSEEIRSIQFGFIST